MTSEEILTSLRKIFRALNLESKRVQKEFGVSIPQILFLNYLYRSPNFQANTKELSQGLSLNPSTVTGIAYRLSHKGYVSRLPKSGDKRVSNIILTATGMKLLESTPKLFHEKLDERLQLLSKAQINQLEEGLYLITSLLEINELDASPMLTIEEPTKQEITPKEKAG